MLFDTPPALEFKRPREHNSNDWHMSHRFPQILNWCLLGRSTITGSRGDTSAGFERHSILATASGVCSANSALGPRSSPEGA
jgi:hypothetical protein